MGQTHSQEPSAPTGNNHTNVHTPPTDRRCLYQLFRYPFHPQTHARNKGEYSILPDSQSLLPSAHIVGNNQPLNPYRSLCLAILLRSFRIRLYTLSGSRTFCPCHARSRTQPSL